MSRYGSPAVNDTYIAEVADILTTCGVPNAGAEAFRFVSDHPGIDEAIPADAAADEWLSAADPLQSLSRKRRR